MSDYSHRPGGSLKFKGDDGGKKKKKKSHSTSDRVAVESSIAESSKAREKLDEVDAIKEMLEREEERDADADKERGRSGEADGELSERKDRERERGREGEQGGRKMTEAERRYEEIQRRRREERVKKSAKMTHKDRVQEFNSKLDKLSEHHDIPRISWTA
ncbi:hypothetical protein EHS25_000207 [Saitozyma podzolica]|uniref:Protein FAM32A n=1 Tax=Saitozyma podzolica TaxID=1890683 RepID=A0A427YVT5_9TREE|nr:hypothetical protein EHS25_000207 [Saitozyma podzolica]